MALFRLEPNALVEQPPATFRELHLYERGDIQRLLRAQPEALGEELLVISEEFGNWEDSRRRIDLLALDRAANLVVIELKRTEDGGHMELQALRYAAMVSSMSFDEVVEAHADHQARTGAGVSSNTESRAAIVDFLEVAERESVALSSDVRILLVSADFGREITTAVLWLNRFEGIDIRCIRLRPYELDGRIILDIDQVIPLPEAADYQIRIGRKDAARARQPRSDGRDFTKYVVAAGGRESPVLAKRNAVRWMVGVLVDAGARVADLRSLFADRVFRELPGSVAPGDDCVHALLEVDLRTDVKRYFTDSPIHQDGKTFVMYRMWGVNTEESLEKLRAAFPAAGASFRAVRPEDD